MNIVVPMAGLGSRFSAVGYELPKPLIDTLGRPMYSWAFDSLQPQVNDNCFFILLATMPYLDVLIKDIETRYSNLNISIKVLDKLTEGQSVTVLSLQDRINNNEPLLIHNSDTAFKIASDWKADLLNEQSDGKIFVFESSEPRWSYSKEVNGSVVEVREKQVISSHASTGTYYFKHGNDFVEIASHHYNNKIKEAGEYYIAPLYNDLVKDGKKVKNVVVDEFYCFGTPEDYNLSLRALNNE